MKVRLALREEGSFWNAYMALENTMDGAKLIGSILIGAARKDPQIKAAFMAVMQQTLANAVQDVTGKAPDAWDVHSAPEAERAGHS
jgi:hypothetical protein